MENIIDSIIDIDKTARNRVSDARKQASAIITSAEESRKDMKKESRLIIKNKIEEKKNSIREVSDNRISAAEKEVEEKCRSLEEKMEQGKSLWKSEIIGRITGA